MRLAAAAGFVAYSLARISAQFSVCIVTLSSQPLPRKHALAPWLPACPATWTLEYDNIAKPLPCLTSSNTGDLKHQLNTSTCIALCCRWTLKYDNIAKPFAFLCVAHFFRAFPTPEKIMLQASSSLGSCVVGCCPGDEACRGWWLQAPRVFRAFPASKNIMRVLDPICCWLLQAFASSPCSCTQALCLLPPPAACHLLPSNTLPHS